MSIITGHINYEVEQKIIRNTAQLDEQILNLDNLMDMRLEKHEQDFLSAYRKHMISVQREILNLKSKGTENEL